MADFTAVKMTALPGLPEIRPGNPLAKMLAEAVDLATISPASGDVLVVAHKVVSKAEGRIVHLDDVTPSARAIELAQETRKDPAKIELILQESAQILRIKPPRPDRESVIICQHRNGQIMANAGIDESNAPGERTVILLPKDADASAQRLRAELAELLDGPTPGIVISDTFGRPWRMGLVNVAIGLAGVPAVIDQTGETDTQGRVLRATVPAFADEVAAAAGLLMHKRAATPAVWIHGLRWPESSAKASDLLRAAEEDLFR